MIAVVLKKPSVAFRGHDISIYWAAPLTGAVLLLTLHLVPAADVWSSLTADTAINPLKILVLFLSMTYLSVFLDEVGFFRYLACITLRKAKTSQTALFISMYLMVSVLTVFTSNDIIILTFTPFICYFAKSANINPIPYLFSEFIAANTWSMALMIGNPTNVYLSTANGIDFLHYASVMFLPTVLSGTVAFVIMYLLFRKSLAKKLEVHDEHAVLADKPAAIVGLVHLGLCTLLLTVSSYIGLEMWLITFAFAVSLLLSGVMLNLLRKGRRRIPVFDAVKRIPFELIPFVLSMFVIVVAMKDAGITAAIVNLFGSRDTVWKYGGASFVVANLINNIPMSVLFSTISGEAPASIASSAAYATVIGSNLCAFFTPIGALAGIMWSGILKKNHVQFSFLTYIKYGAAVSIPTLMAALESLMLVLS